MDLTRAASGVQLPPEKILCSKTSPSSLVTSNPPVKRKSLWTASSTCILCSSWAGCSLAKETLPAISDLLPGSPDKAQPHPRPRNLDLPLPSQAQHAAGGIRATVTDASSSGTLRLFRKCSAIAASTAGNSSKTGPRQKARMSRRQLRGRAAAAPITARTGRGRLSSQQFPTWCHCRSQAAVPSLAHANCTHRDSSVKDPRSSSHSHSCPFLQYLRCNP